MNLPRAGRRLRLLALAYGVTLFLWLSVEDNTIWPVTVLGLGLSSLVLTFAFLDKLGGSWVSVRSLPLVAVVFGAIVGLGTAVAATALMFFKNAMHAHVFLDYPPGLLLAIMQRAFGWAAAGALTGLGLTLAGLALRSKTLNDEQNTEDMAEDTP